ncbi:hypothetical protein C5167_008082 [Papaver somniferum]|uniref:Uncharacterized protein n=1 Tax=Papaver somniferum TaxID=3469 RepID=A0A4Y7JXA0_PAPSO|nr:hypothetical protein C5167_008082 [Papaver somniferum]
MVNEIGAIDDDLGFLEEESGSISYSSIKLMMFELVEEEGNFRMGVIAELQVMMATDMLVQFRTTGGQCWQVTRKNI